MASGSTGRPNSGSKGFDFGTDDVLCSYEDYGNQESSNGSHSDLSVANSSKVRLVSYVDAVVWLVFFSGVGWVFERNFEVWNLLGARLGFWIVEFIPFLVCLFEGDGY